MTSRKSKRTKVWKIGQTRAFPWKPEMAALFAPLPIIGQEPQNVKVRLNRLTVTVTAKAGCKTYIARHNRREFFA